MEASRKFRFQTDSQYKQAMIDLIKSRDLSDIISDHDDEEYEELAEEFIAFCDAKED